MPDPAGPLDRVELERVAAAAARGAADLVAAALAQARPGAAPAADVAARSAADAGRLIGDLLAEATPDAGLLLSRRTSTAPAAPLQWVVEPLDRSVNLAHDIPLVAVSIAAAVDGEIVAGAVVDVLRAELFSAHLGGGARRDGQAIAVSSCAGLADGLVAIAFSDRAEIRRGEAEIASRVLAGARGLRSYAAAALELCWVGCGRLDGYLGRGVEAPGYAAGALIAGESGAVAELPCPENDDLVIAATPGVFDELQAISELPATPPSS